MDTSLDPRQRARKKAAGQRSAVRIVGLRFAALSGHNPASEPTHAAIGSRQWRA